MKKFGLYIMTLLSLGVVSCHEDFDPEVGPQSNPQEAALQVADVTVSSSAQPQTVSISDYLNEETGEETDIPVETVTVKEGALPANAVLTAVLQFSKTEDFAKSVEVKGAVKDNMITVSPSDLQNAYFNNITRSPKATDLYVRTVLYVVTDEASTAIVGTPGNNYFDTHKIAFTPKDMKVKISDAYYLVGGAMDWAASASAKSQKFTHSDIDVYDDPEFTYIMESTGGEMWFAFGDEAALDAITNDNVWGGLFGTKGESGDLSGSFDTRDNLGGDHSFKVDGAATYYRIVINVLDMTYEITPVTIAAQYYLVGAINGWSDSKKICMMTPVGNNKLSYTTKWEGDHNLKIWAGPDYGNWDKALGTPTDGDASESGVIDGSGAIVCPEKDAFYTFTIDLTAMTYQWTKLESQEPTVYTNISLIGAFNEWKADVDLEQVAPHNWYTEFTQEAEDGQLKFRANHGWDINWGFGKDKDWDVTASINKIGTNGGGNVLVPKGTYDVYFNDITGSMIFVAK